MQPLTPHRTRTSRCEWRAALQLHVQPTSRQERCCTTAIHQWRSAVANVAAPLRLTLPTDTSLENRPIRSEPNSTEFVDLGILTVNDV